MKKEKWIVNGFHIVMATEEEIMNWCIIQNKLGEHYNAALDSGRITISKKVTNTLEIKIKN